MQSMPASFTSDDRRLVAEHTSLVSSPAGERLRWSRAALFVLGLSVALWFALAQVFLHLMS